MDANNLHVAHVQSVKLLRQTRRPRECLHIALVPSPILAEQLVQAARHIVQTIDAKHL